MGIAEYSSRTVDTDVVVLDVRLTQEMYEVVDELRRTVNCLCNHRTRYQRGGNSSWNTSLKVTNAFLPSADDSFATPKIFVVLQYDRTCTYSEMNRENNARSLKGIP